MKRLVASLVLALVVAGVATASRGDPQKQFTTADQARAKAMLLRHADVGADFKASKSSPDELDFYCKAIDESDLVLTGDADSPDFVAEDDVAYEFVSSGGQVYKTAAQNAESWRRGTSAAGKKCGELLWRRIAREAGATFVSFREIAFPRLAPETVAYRGTARIKSTLLIFDLVAFGNGRAQSTIVFVTTPSAYPRSERVRLGQIVARRTAAAMRGA